MSNKKRDTQTDIKEWIDPEHFISKRDNKLYHITPDCRIVKVENTKDNA